MSGRFPLVLIFRGRSVPAKRWLEYKFRYGNHASRSSWVIPYIQTRLNEALNSNQSRVSRQSSKLKRSDVYTDFHLTLVFLSDRLNEMLKNIYIWRNRTHKVGHNRGGANGKPR